jgi:hypothetical protein
MVEVLELPAWEKGAPRLAEQADEADRVVQIGQANGIPARICDVVRDDAKALRRAARYEGWGRWQVIGRACTRFGMVPGLLFAALLVARGAASQTGVDGAVLTSAFFAFLIVVTIGAVFAVQEWPDLLAQRTIAQDYPAHRSLVQRLLAMRRAGRPIQVARGEDGVWYAVEVADTVGSD